MHKHASNYKTRHILITAGGDHAFRYSEPHFSFLERVMVLLHGKSIKLENGKTMTFQFKYSSIDSYISEMKVEADK